MYCLPQCRRPSYTPVHNYPLLSASLQPEKPQIPSVPPPALAPPAKPKEKFKAGSPSSLDSQASTAIYSLCPRLAITYNETALSHLQGRPQVKISNNLPIPFPSDRECSTSDDMSTDGNLSTDDDTDGTDDPAEFEADSSNNHIESPTADRGMECLPHNQDVHMTVTRSDRSRTRPATQGTHQMSRSSQGRQPCNRMYVLHREHTISGQLGPHFRTIRSQNFHSYITIQAFQDHRVPVL